MKDLPAPVQETVKAQTRNARLVGLSKEIEKGKTFYEAETKVNGISRDILIDDAGAVVEIEEATTLESIPAAARAGLQQLAGQQKITRVETVTKGSVVTYEAVVKKNGRPSEISVTADGAPVAKK
jgi:hypothetical protein